MHRKLHTKAGRSHVLKQDGKLYQGGVEVQLHNTQINFLEFVHPTISSPRLTQKIDLYPHHTEQKRTRDGPTSKSQAYPPPSQSRIRQKSFKVGEARIKTGKLVQAQRYAKESKSESCSPGVRQVNQSTPSMLGGFSTPIKNNYVDDQVPETINIHRIVSDDSLLSDKVKAEESDHSFEVNVARRPMILTSQYLGRPPTLFFQYPPICEQKRSQLRARFMDALDEKRYTPSFRVHGQIPYKCVTSAFECAGFRRYDDEADESEDDCDWNVMWGIGTRKTMKNMNKYQKINHFPGCWHLGRKDNLWMNLSKMKRKHPKDFDFIPTTYLLAYDYDRFIAQREQASKHSLWIMKPCAAARGRGIRMISKKSKVTKKKNYLIMEYISSPHLINGFKYDLRVYVLISGFDPLRVYIYKEGLVRFATETYSVHQKDLSKKYIHLTNFAINKNSPHFIKNQNSNQDDQGSKWSHTALRRKYKEMGIDSEKLFHQVADVVLKTCIASEPFMLDSNAKSPDHKNGFFELYGFDVLIDQDLKPWVLEANVCPSLNSASPLDKKIKTALISDIMHLVGVPLWDKSKKKSTNTLGSPVHIKQPMIFSKNLNDVQNINYANCHLKLTPEDWNQILTIKEEASRCGNFECIYPIVETMSYYQQFFEFPRYNNKLIERFFEEKEKWIERYQPT